MSSLAVIVPTRGRPQAVAELAQAWADTNTEATLVLGLDDDDPALHDYGLAVERAGVEYPGVRIEVVTGPRLRMIGTLNAIAVDYAMRYDCIAFLGDDHRPRGDRPLERLVKGLHGRTGIAYGDDLYQGEAMATAVVMSSDIIRALGYMCPTTFQHLKADVVWVVWGAAIKRLSYDETCIIEHVHPYLGKAAWDEGYADANSDATWAHDDEAYHQYMTGGGFHADVEKLQALV